MAGVLSFLDVGEDGAQLLVGSHKAAAAFSNQFGCAACQGREFVDVAVIALHVAQNIFKFCNGLVISKFFYGCHIAIFYFQL